MLVVISDLHLCDGTAGDVLQAGAFELFAERVSELAMRASWRTDGQYRPLDRLDLVLLGDVIDLMRSQQWFATGARPWQDPLSPTVIDTVQRIVEETLRRNQAGVETLRTLSAEAALRLPPATQSGEPVFAAEGIPVTVRTHYMVGNHDWLLHLAGERYDAIREQIIRQLGLANARGEPFPHDPIESDELLTVLRRHRVLARHGDSFDPLNYPGTRDAASLGDALVIELANRFLAEVTARYAETLSPALLFGFAEMAHIRPLLLIPVWIDGLLERSGVRPELRRDLKRLWDQQADDFLQLPILREQDTWSPFQLVDGLQRALKFSQRLSIGWAARITNWLQELRGSTSDSYHLHALAEPDFRNRRARHIVYGHTHWAETVPLDASYADGYVLNQVYFNSGTWRRVYRQTQWAPGEQEFIPTDMMSCVVFYQGDERGGRPFETWNGTLAVSAGDVAVHRLDMGRPIHAAEQSLSSSKLPVRAPHFGRAVPASRSTPSSRQ